MKQLHKCILLGFCMIILLACQKTTANTLPLSTRLQAFALDSFKLLNDEQKEDNVLYSPLSLYMALQLCMEGADGATKDDLMRVLHMDGSSSDEWQALYQTMNENQEHLQIASSIWVNNHKLLPSYEEMAKRYQTDIFYEDFTKVDINSQISDWIREHTNQLPLNVIPVNSQSVVSMFHTVYVQNQWMNPFETTYTAPFFTTKEKRDHYDQSGDTTKEIEYMETSLETKQKITNIYTAVSLPMENNTTMNVYLPNASYGVEDILEDSSDLFQMDPTLKTTAVRLPPISIHSGNHLNTMLHNLGGSSLLQDPDFSNMIEDVSFSFSDIFQDNILIADQEGVEAGTLTEFTYIGLESTEQMIKFDKPFLFIIMYDDATIQIPLMMGIYRNPLQTQIQ